MYLDDIYGEQEILRDGVIPRRLVTSCEHFHREAAGIVPPNGVRIHVAGIDLIRDAAGQLPGARGQPALAVGGVLRDGEPPHDGAGLPEPVRHPSRAGGRRLLVASAAGAAQLRGHQRGRPDGRRAHPRRVQLGLLRAFAAGPSDGCRTRRGPRPVLPRQHRLHAHHRGRAPGRRHLPPHRRRVPRPDAFPAGLGARASPGCSTPRAPATW